MAPICQSRASSGDESSSAGSDAGDEKQLTVDIHTAVGDGNRSSSMDESSPAGTIAHGGKQSTASGLAKFVNGHTAVGEGRGAT